MKNKAQIKSHPIHPILVSFPIAFFVSVFVLDALVLFTKKEWLFEIAGLLEITGIISGLIAAIPGAIDYFGTIPPESSAKKRANKHALLNISMILIFTIAYGIRNSADLIILALLEMTGVILLCIAGWHGGTLVYRNQIGVDMRYAGAGKWNEEKIETKETTVVIGRTDELKDNQMKLVHINNKRIVLGRSEGKYYAFDDHCTHRGGSLAGGALICGTVQCPWHGSQFDIASGEVKAGPAKASIKTYEIKIEGTEIILSLPPILLQFRN